MDDRLEITARAERLRVALNNAGGAAAVAKRIGMPATTISNYVAGRDLKASALVALADGCGVSLEWLATGNGTADKAPESLVLPAQQAVWQLPGEISNAMDAPINYYLFALCLRSCREFFERESLPKPTLRVALGWMGGPYSLHATMPDQDFLITFPAKPA